MIRTWIKRAVAVSCLLIGAAVLLSAPAFFGKKPMIVLSGSMEPTFGAGSLIYMEEASYEEIRAGDIVTYGNTTFVSHRVIEKHEKERALITMGDANESEDPAVKEQEIRGRVCKGVYIPYAGYFLAWMKRPAVLGALTALFLIHILADGIVFEKRKTAVPEYDSKL